MVCGLGEPQAAERESVTITAPGGRVRPLGSIRGVTTRLRRPVSWRGVVDRFELRWRRAQRRHGVSHFVEHDYLPQPLVLSRCLFRLCPCVAAVL